MRDEAEFSELQGKTCVAVSGGVGGDRVEFTLSDGTKYALLHHESCCERVAIEDICGDLGDLVGTPIVLAEEASSENADAFGGNVEASRDYRPDSFTWTFYKLRTHKGDVTIRWLGTSNGYYSESVSFERIGNVGES